MLFVKRKIGESVTITGLRGNTREITVTVLGLKDGIIQLGLETATEIAETRVGAWDRADTTLVADNARKFSDLISR